MSEEDLLRIPVSGRVLDGAMTAKEAANAQGISWRQVRRQMRAFRCCASAGRAGSAQPSPAPDANTASAGNGPSGKDSLSRWMAATMIRSRAVGRARPWWPLWTMPRAKSCATFRQRRTPWAICKCWMRSLGTMACPKLCARIAIPSSRAPRPPPWSRSWPERKATEPRPKARQGGQPAEDHPSQSAHLHKTEVHQPMVTF